MADNIETTETKKKSKEKLVPLTLPLTYDPDIDFYPEPISLNFKTYTVKRGETVMVPPSVEKIVLDRDAARQKAYQYSMQKSLSAKEAEFKQKYGLQD